MSFSDEPPYEITSNPWLSADEIKLLKKTEDALDRLYNSGRFLYTLDYLTDEIGISPFDIFCEFGNKVDGNKMQLSDYARHLYLFFSDKCDKEKLREKIVCDLLCSSSSVQIPECLKTNEPLYKRAKKYFTENVDKNIKIAILHTENKIFTVNHGKPKNLHNRYEGKLYSLDILP